MRNITAPTLIALLLFAAVAAGTLVLALQASPAQAFLLGALAVLLAPAAGLLVLLDLGRAALADLESQESPEASPVALALDMGTETETTDTAARPAKAGRDTGARENADG